MLIVALLAPAALAGPEAARVREVVPLLASAEVDVRNKAQWELLGLIGEAKSEAAAKSTALDVIQEIARASSEAKLGVDPKFFAAQLKRVKTVKPKAWVDHFLAAPEDVVYLAGTVPNRFRGAACINEIAVPVGNCIARFIQRTEEERLRARGITTPPGMVLVPAGEFVTGSSQREIDYCIKQMEGSEGWTKYPRWRTSDIAEYRSEVPRRLASTGTFYIDAHELTNEQYRGFCAASGYEPPTSTHLGVGQSGGFEPFFAFFAWRGSPPTYPSGHGDRPFIFANLARGEAFGTWAKKRLPNEIEWEKAARGIDGRVWPWGSSFDKQLAQTPERQNQASAYASDYLPVVSLPEGQSPWGCVQIAGNAWEVALPSEEPEADREDGSRTTTAEARPKCVATSKGGDAAHSVSHAGTNSRAARRKIWDSDIAAASYATFRFVRGVERQDEE
ncbi:MAG TPA: SUMF1/EgtB/PvdO family nonheme iron enzyme [Candidatus Eisenbacteria bacterium]|nr:SUMF1/EgtB/PvdO family nonheme iron enzyme [Candidatus Eisenbacteria bacterium]